MTNNIVNQYLTRVSHFAGEYVMLIYLREGAENIDGHSGMMLQSIASGGCGTSEFRMPGVNHAIFHK